MKKQNLLIILLLTTSMILVVPIRSSEGDCINYSGLWQGKTSQSHNILLNISNNVLEYVSFGYTVRNKDSSSSADMDLYNLGKLNESGSFLHHHVLNNDNLTFSGSIEEGKDLTGSFIFNTAIFINGIPSNMSAEATFIAQRDKIYEFSGCTKEHVGFPSNYSDSNDTSSRNADFSFVSLIIILLLPMRISIYKKHLN